MIRGFQGLAGHVQANRRCMRTRRGFRPSLVGLESRRVPSVTMEGATIAIQGTAGSDRIEIVEDRDAQLIEIVENGQSFRFSTNVRIGLIHIAVDLGDGDDSLSYRQQDATWNSNIRNSVFDIDLGRGRDTLEMRFDAAVDGTPVTINRDVVIDVEGGEDDSNDTILLAFGTVEACDVEVNARGGGGNDLITVFQSGDIRSRASRSGAVDLALRGDAGDDSISVFASTSTGLVCESGSRFRANLLGNFGLDHVNFSYAGRIDGDVVLRSDGGWGNDRMHTAVNLLSRSRGRLDAYVTGGWGDDTLTFLLDEPDFGLTIVDATLYGDLGNDRLGSVRGRVRVINV